MLLEAHDFVDKVLVLEELEKRGVMNDLVILSQILPLHDRKKVMAAECLSNSTKGQGTRDFVVSDMHRVTFTGDYESLMGSPVVENLSDLAKDLPEGAHAFLQKLMPKPGVYRYHPYKGVKCWEVSGFCSLLIQSAPFPGGTKKIRWKGAIKPSAISETTRYVEPTLPIEGLETSSDKLPPRLPILVLAYCITPEGETKELILGLPTLAKHRDQNPWVWTIDLLEYAETLPASSTAISDMGAPMADYSRVPAVPDAHVKLKKTTK